MCECVTQRLIISLLAGVLSFSLSPYSFPLLLSFSLSLSLHLSLSFPPSPSLSLPLPLSGQRCVNCVLCAVPAGWEQKGAAFDCL